MLQSDLAHAEEAGDDAEAGWAEIEDAGDELFVGARAVRRISSSQSVPAEHLMWLQRLLLITSTPELGKNGQMRLRGNVFYSTLQPSLDGLISIIIVLIAPQLDMLDIYDKKNVFVIY